MGSVRSPGGGSRGVYVSKRFSTRGLFSLSSIEPASAQGGGQHRRGSTTSKTDREVPSTAGGGVALKAVCC